jgi:tRNA (guanine10-N2)-methyltransferase
MEHRYGLAAPEVVRCDVSLFSRHFRRVALYDAIVCDPPYGIRAGARKSGNRRGADAVRAVPADLRGVHVPQTQPYPVEDVLVDLLNLAAFSLVLGGRLVFLLPTTYDFSDDDLPKHPCLNVVANSEQPLNQKMGRRLITLAKVREFSDSDRAAYDQVATSSSSRPFSMLREKMQGDALAGSLDRRDAKRLKKVAAAAPGN